MLQLLFIVYLKWINVFIFSSELTKEPLYTSRDKCVYYNKTTNKIFTSAYEGIPENLLLNFLGWMVGSCFKSGSK